MVFKKKQIPHNKIEVNIELMKKLYYVDKLDYKQIAEYFGLKSKSCIYDRFKKLGLKARTNMDLKTGFKHSKETKIKIGNSLRGKHHLPEWFKQQSRERWLIPKNNPSTGMKRDKHFNWKDGIRTYRNIAKEEKKWSCEFCNSHKFLDVHHKDFNRHNNQLINLQVVCRSCHNKIHHSK